MTRLTNGLVAQQSIETLEALVGATRAWLLEAIGDGRTTGELAGRVGVAASSVSQHTSVLRDARLIRTSRVGRSVVHTLTPLGRSLLEGQVRTEDGAVLRRQADRDRRASVRSMQDSTS